LNTANLVFLSHVESPEQRRRRSLLYALAFCALAMAVEWLALMDREDSFARGYFWLVCSLALLAGLMALVVRHGAQASPRSSASRPAEAARQPTAEDGLSTLGAWRQTRASRFGEFDLEFLPPLPDVPAMAQESGSRPAARRPQKAAERPDPWAQALDEFDNRDRKQK
jgi:hypothetical protein